MKRKLVLKMDNGGGFALKLSKDEYSYLLSHKVTDIKLEKEGIEIDLYISGEGKTKVYLGNKIMSLPEFICYMEKAGFLFGLDYNLESNLTLHQAAEKVKKQKKKIHNKIREIKRIRAKNLRPIAFSQLASDFINSLKK